MLTTETLLTILTLIFLLGYTFFPNRIRVDKYTLSLFALLLLITILPTLSSGSISYLFSFKRSVELAKQAVKKATGREGKKSDQIKSDQRGPYFTTAQIKEELRKRLDELQKKRLAPEEKIQPADPLHLAVHLNHKGVIDNTLLWAIQRVINTCDLVDYDSKLTPQEVQKLINISIPLLEKLS